MKELNINIHVEREELIDLLSILFGQPKKRTQRNVKFPKTNTHMAKALGVDPSNLRKFITHPDLMREKPPGEKAYNNLIQKIKAKINKTPISQLPNFLDSLDEVLDSYLTETISYFTDFIFEQYTILSAKNGSEASISLRQKTIFTLKIMDEIKTNISQKRRKLRKEKPDLANRINLVDVAEELFPLDSFFDNTAQQLVEMGLSAPKKPFEKAAWEFLQILEDFPNDKDLIYAEVSRIVKTVHTAQFMAIRQHLKTNNT